VIDKVEVRVPAGAAYAPKFGTLYRDLFANPKLNPFKPSQHYLQVGDLRDFGYEVILHAHCKHGEGNHKLELIHSGKMGYGQILSELGKVFDYPASRMEITRVDFAADVEGLSVSWFLKNARVGYKQFTADIQKEYTRMGKRAVETLYYGRRPNVIRIYDKIAEHRYQYQRLRKSEKEIEPFETVYGVPMDGYVLTRVERQCGGCRIPEQLVTVEDLQKAAKFNPFGRIEILSGGRAEPNADNYDSMTYLAGVGLREKVEEIGLHRTRQLVNQRSKGNASRIFNRLSEFLPGDNSGGLDAAGLYERYRESVTRQLAA
jgi:hypothetical protein